MLLLAHPMVNRHSSLLFRMTEQEHHQLRWRAATEGLTMAKYIRQQLGMTLKDNRGGARPGSGRPPAV